MQSYLVRAHYVEAGLLDKLKGLAKKTVMSLVSLGFLTSVANGMTINKGHLQKITNDFNHSMQDDGLGTTLTTTYKPGTSGATQVVFLYDDGEGNKAEVVLNQKDGKTSMNKKFTPHGKDSDAGVLADLLYKSLESKMKTEGIKLEPINIPMHFGD